MRPARYGFRCALRTRLGLVLVLAAAIHCVPPHPRRALPPDVGEIIRSVIVVNAVEDELPGAHFMREMSITPYFMVTYSTIDEQEAKRHVKVLRRVAEEMGFRDMCLAAVDSVVNAATWPELRSTRAFEYSCLPTEAREALLDSSGADGVLSVTLSYHFEVRDGFLVVDADATFWRGDDRSALYRSSFHYLSEPAPELSASPILEWTMDDGVRFRNETLIGVQQVTTMLAEDFFATRGSPVETRGEDEFEYAAGNEMTRWSGTILSKHGQRLLVRRNDGNLFSLPVGFRKPQTAFKRLDYRFTVTHRPDPRMAVYVHHPTGDAKIWMQPSVELAWNVGLSPGRVREVLKLAKERCATIEAAWQRCHPGDP